MSGMVVGSIVSFIANRYFAFPDSGLQLGKSAVRYFVQLGISIIIHGQVVTYLHDSKGFPYVPSKFAADVMVLTIPQLLILRYLVFPKRRGPPAAQS